MVVARFFAVTENAQSEADLSTLASLAVSFSGRFEPFTPRVGEWPVFAQSGRPRFLSRSRDAQGSLFACGGSMFECPAPARLSHCLLVGRRKRRKLTSSGWRGKMIPADGRGGKYGPPGASRHSLWVLTAEKWGSGPAPSTPSSRRAAYGRGRASCRRSRTRRRRQETQGGRRRLGNPRRLEGLVDGPPLAAHDPRDVNRTCQCQFDFGRKGGRRRL